MARRTSLIKLDQISDINMTPLMDLTFILLITFIITFPLIEQGIAINLPDGKATDVSKKISKSISLNYKNELFIDNQRVTKNELKEVLIGLSESNPNLTIFVRADENLPYGKVMEIMRILNDVKIKSMALITETE